MSRPEEKIKTLINAHSFNQNTKHDDCRTVQRKTNSFARLSANEESLCTSETSVTVSQKMSWLTHSDPQRGARTRQQRLQSGGGFSVQAIYNDHGQGQNVNTMPTPSSSNSQNTWENMKKLNHSIKRHWGIRTVSQEAILISEQFTDPVVAIETLNIWYQWAWQKGCKLKLM